MQDVSSSKLITQCPPRNASRSFSIDCLGTWRLAYRNVQQVVEQTAQREARGILNPFRWLTMDPFDGTDDDFNDALGDPDPRDVPGAAASWIEPIYACQDLPTAIASAWAAIARANDPPILFRYGGNPVRLGTDDSERLVFESLITDKMRQEVSRAAPWRRRIKNKTNGEWTEAPVIPPDDVVKDMLATPSAKMLIPLVYHIAEVPTFAADGTLCDRPDTRHSYRGRHGEGDGDLLRILRGFPVHK